MITQNTYTSNNKTLTGPLTYYIRDTDDILNVYTKEGPVTIILQNIKNSGLDKTPKQICINDAGGACSSNNITIYGGAGDTVNSDLSFVMDQNSMSAKFSIVNINEWLVSSSKTPSVPPTTIYHDDTLTGTGTLLDPLKVAGNYGRVLFVSTNGNGTTAVPGVVGLPYPSPSAAQSVAMTGDLIMVMPGIYTETSPLGKNGVDWFFFGGATVNNSTSVWSANNATFKIFGYGDFNQTGLLVAVPLFNFTNTTAEIYMNNGSSASFAYGFIVADLGSNIDITFNVADCTQRDGDFLTAFNGSTINAYGNEARFRRIAMYTEQYLGRYSTINSYVKNIVALDPIADFTQFAPTYVYCNSGGSEVNHYGLFTNEQTTDTASVVSYVAITGSSAISPIIRLFGAYTKTRTTNGISANAGAYIYVKSNLEEAQGRAVQINAAATVYLDGNRVVLTGATFRPAISGGATSNIIMNGCVVIGNDAISGSLNFTGTPNVKIYQNVFANQPVVGAYINLITGSTVIVSSDVE